MSFSSSVSTRWAVTSLASSINARILASSATSDSLRIACRSVTSSASANSRDAASFSSSLSACTRKNSFSNISSVCEHNLAAAFSSFIASKSLTSSDNARNLALPSSRCRLQTSALISLSSSCKEDAVNTACRSPTESAAFCPLSSTSCTLRPSPGCSGVCCRASDMKISVSVSVSASSLGVPVSVCCR